MQECSLSLTLCCILCTFVSKFCCCPAEWQLVIRNLAQSLIHRVYPSVSGMQDVSLAQTLAFDVVNGECADSAHWRRPLVDDINYWMYKWRSWHLWQLNASCNWNTGAANCSNSTEHNHNKVWINCINTYLWLFFNLSGTDHVSNKLGEQILLCLPLLLLQCWLQEKILQHAILYETIWNHISTTAFPVERGLNFQQELGSKTEATSDTVKSSKLTALAECQHHSLIQWGTTWAPMLNLLSSDGFVPHDL